MRMERFEDIEAWRLAREMTRKTYLLARKPEFAGDPGLKKRIQETAGTAMHSIAQGLDSQTDREFILLLRYAIRSCTEVQSELYVALDEHYISETEFNEVYDQARRTRSAIRGFIGHLRSGEGAPRPACGTQARDNGAGNREPFAAQRVRQAPAPAAERRSEDNRGAWYRERGSQFGQRQTPGKHEPALSAARAGEE